MKSEQQAAGCAIQMYITHGKKLLDPLKTLSRKKHTPNLFATEFHFKYAYFSYFSVVAIVVRLVEVVFSEGLSAKNHFCEEKKKNMRSNWIF